MAYIKQIFSNDNAMTTLNLRQTWIGVEGTRILSDVLCHNTTLTTLDLRSNGIGDNGAQFIAKALRHNNTLTTLNLSSNGIGTEGAQLIANALRHNNTLTTLDLGQNLIGYVGVKLIVDACAETRVDAEKINRNMSLSLLLGSRDPSSLIYKLPHDGCLLQQIIKTARVIVPNCQISF